MIDSEDIRKAAVQKAIETLHKNQDCFVAQWVLQNQDKNIDDYELVTTQPNYRIFSDEIEYSFYMREKR